MRAREFVTESNFNKDHQAAIPGAEKYMDLDNSNPYHMWRYMVAVGARDGKGNGHKLPLEGPTGQKLTTVAYSKEDENILHDTAKMLGFKPTKMSNRDSVEPNDIHRVSPVRAFKGYSR